LLELVHRLDPRYRLSFWCCNLQQELKEKGGAKLQEKGRKIQGLFGGADGTTKKNCRKDEVP